MCGRLNVTDDPFLAALMAELGLSTAGMIFSNDIAPGGQLSIVRQAGQQRIVCDATWWLLLDNHTLKPNYRYASFNSRYDKLNIPRSAAYAPYRQRRCIIPASGFVEGLGDKKSYFQLQPVAGAIGFGGIYNEWLDRESGTLIYSASVITLPPHPKLKDIHPKSMPLMLPCSDQPLIDDWLNPDCHDIERFQSLLDPALRESQRVTPIDRPGTRRAVGEPFMIPAD